MWQVAAVCSGGAGIGVATQRARDFANIAEKRSRTLQISPLALCNPCNFANICSLTLQLCKTPNARYITIITIPKSYQELQLDSLILLQLIALIRCKQQMQL